MTAPRHINSGFRHRLLSTTGHKDGASLSLIKQLSRLPSSFCLIKGNQGHLAIGTINRQSKAHRSLWHRFK